MGVSVTAGGVSVQIKVGLGVSVSEGTTVGVEVGGSQRWLASLNLLDSAASPRIAAASL
jgi:hypothetical protein